MEAGRFLKVWELPDLVLETGLRFSARTAWTVGLPTISPAPGIRFLTRPSTGYFAAVVI